MIPLLLHIWSLLTVVGWTEDFTTMAAAQSRWIGTWQTLQVNRNGQLQNLCSEACENELWRSSTAAIEAEWTMDARLYGGTSDYNRIRLYLTDEDRTDTDGYFIQIGGANKNITLWRQQDGTATKVIEHAERKKMLDMTDIRVSVRLTRDADGVFHLFSFADEKDQSEVEEGGYFVNEWHPHWVGITMRSSNARGQDMYVDNVSVSGAEQIAPVVDELAGEASAIRISLLDESLSLDQPEPTARVAYESGGTACRGTVCVYSADGLLVRTLCRNEALMPEGLWLWHGDDDHGRRVPIGVYVLIVEVTGDNCRPLRKRMPIAVIH